MERRGFLKACLLASIAPVFIKREVLGGLWVPPEPKIIIPHMQRDYFVERGVCVGMRGGGKSDALRMAREAMDQQPVPMENREGWIKVGEKYYYTTTTGEIDTGTNVSSNFWTTTAGSNDYIISPNINDFATSKVEKKNVDPKSKFVHNQNYLALKSKINYRDRKWA